MSADRGASGVRRVKIEAGLNARAYTELKRSIVEGRLRPGSLTSVRELSEALGISRTPVREALVDLAGDGLVRFERNRGVRILTVHPHDIEEIFELRLMLEVGAVRQGVRRCRPGDIAKLEEKLDAMLQNLDDEERFMRHDRAFHRHVLDLSRNRRLVEFIEGLRDVTRMFGISTVGRSRSLKDIAQEHALILDRIKEGDVEGAALAMEQHLHTTLSLLLKQHAERGSGS